MRKKSQQPQASQNAQSLTSSSTLPEFEDLERIYMEDFAQLEEEKSNEVKPKKIRKTKVAAESIPENQEGIDTGQSIQVTGEEIEEWTSFPMDLVLQRMDKKPLGKIERKAWARSCAAVINKYAPQVASKYGPEIGLCICLAAIFGTRMSPPNMEDKEISKGDKQAESLSHPDVFEKA